jgi:Pyruvate flavodoxin/ferredoxin oxidoreductase, thiamine diP-bdg
MSSSATMNGVESPTTSASDEKKDDVPTEAMPGKTTTPPAKKPFLLLPNGPRVCVDGNYATAHAAYRMNDCAFVFPITPSSPMGEFSDEMANVQHKRNVFGQELKIVELQSEGGAGTLP